MLWNMPVWRNRKEMKEKCRPQQRKREMKDDISISFLIPSPLSWSSYARAKRRRKERKEGRDRRNHRSITKKRKGKEMTLRWVPSCRVLPSFFLSSSPPPFLPSRAPGKNTPEKRLMTRTKLMEEMSSVIFFLSAFLSSLLSVGLFIHFPFPFFFYV